MVDIRNLRERVKEIVARDDVKYVIGYEKGTYGFKAAPSFAFTAEDADKFIFSPLCVHNLVGYYMLEEKLPLGKNEEEDPRKVGIMVKGCDSKAIVQILQEKGMTQENIVIIGIPCTGVIDPKKIAAKFPNQVEGVDIEEDGDYFVFNINGKTHKIPKEEVVFDKCIHCENPNPVIYDVLIGDEVEVKGKEDYENVKIFEEKPLEEKWEYWKNHFERCIRCYACREVCPLCYCEECMVDHLSPQWVRRSVDLSENTAWNILRAYHLAGRCIGCGECERVCPMDIPLMELNKKLEKDVKELFEYKAGLDPNAEPLLAMFKPDDSEEFII
jgi:ferredoxin